MTISSSVSKVSYTGDGSTNNWPITFAINGVRDTEIEVYLVDRTTNVSTKLESNYLVDLNVPEVVYPLSGTPISNSYGVVLLRKLELNQQIDLKNQGPIPAEVIEQGLDRTAMQFQQMQEQIDRTIKADISQDQATLDEVTQQAAANAAAAASSAATAASSQAVAEAASASAQLAQAAAEAARDAAQSVANIQAASQAEAEAAANNTKFMTPLRVKQEVEFPGAVSIPVANISGLSTGVPAGIIAMWSGLIADIPSGWVFCDGTNSTPDLRDRMIMGARQDNGGVAKTNVSGALTQTGGEAAHTMTLAELVPHAHTYLQSPWQGARYDGSSSPVITSQVSGTTGSAGGGAPFNVLNPYYALAFIMKS